MVTLIFCGDLIYCPYIKRYIERIEKKKCSYQVLFWNRANLKLDLPNNYFYYNSPSDESLNKTKKMIDFWGFRNWVKEHISKNKTDGLILLSTLTGIILFNKLKKYKKKYIFDIRDYSYENILLFKTIEKNIIKNSFFTAISSKGFKAFLPKHDYVIAHNFNRNEMNSNVKFKKQQVPLKIVWNGTIRFFEFQKKYLNVLKNDERFIIIYHGNGTDLEKYVKYCEEEKIFNVEFTGYYDNDYKKDILEGAAFINNCYGGADGDQLKYAISNRYYDGLIFHIPQLVESGGYKDELIKKNQVGIALEPDEHFADSLYSYYMGINKKNFDICCDKAIEDIIIEDNIYISEIDKFIDNIKVGK